MILAVFLCGCGPATFTYMHTELCAVSVRVSKPPWCVIHGLVCVRVVRARGARARVFVGVRSEVRESEREKEISRLVIERERDERESERDGREGKYNTVSTQRVRGMRV